MLRPQGFCSNKPSPTLGPDNLRGNAPINGSRRPARRRIGDRELRGATSATRRDFEQLKDGRGPVPSARRPLIAV
jgi:hypothetical protein